MADSAQFELYAISLGLIVPHNLDEFELSRSFLFRFRSASKERLRKLRIASKKIANIDLSVWRVAKQQFLNLASKRPLRTNF